MTEGPTSGSAPKIFSYPVDVAAVPPGGLDVSIAADVETLRALAAADDLPSISRLEASFHLSPRGDNEVNVSGELRATITQICVVTLEPFDTEIVEPIDVDFAPEDKSKARASSAAEAALGDEALAGARPTGSDHRRQNRSRRARQRVSGARSRSLSAQARRTFRAARERR